MLPKKTFKEITRYDRILVTIELPDLIQTNALRYICDLYTSKKKKKKKRDMNIKGESKA